MNPASIARRQPLRVLRAAAAVLALVLCSAASESQDPVESPSEAARQEPLAPAEARSDRQRPTAGPGESLEAPSRKEPTAIEGAASGQSGSSASAAIRAILGLVAILALAYLAGHPRVQALEVRLGIAQVVTAGFPFVLLGVLARQPAIGILPDPVFAQIQPLLPIGLGWIGFVIGFRFEIRALDGLPRGTAAAVGLLTAVPFALIVSACGLLLLVVWGLTPGAISLRDAILLGTAGAVTARSASSLLVARGGGAESVDRVARIVQLEELAALAGLVLVAAFFRPQGPVVAWQLPGTAWVFVSLGLGTAVGLLAFALFGSFRAGQEVVVVLIGTICFAAGMASYLRLSPVAVCAIAGLLLVSLPGPWKRQLREDLDRLERPVYLLFLFIAGALWRFTDIEGWILMAVFVIARLGGKWLALAIHSRFQFGGLGAAERKSLLVSPIGALAVAIVVNARDLYSGPSLSWIVTAIIGGSVLTEVIVQVLTRTGHRQASTQA
jgi:hypothetical protein